MKSEELLGAAEVVLQRRDFTLNGAWPRAVALLSRQALEQALDEFWETKLPGMRAASRRTQMSCLSMFEADQSLTQGVTTSWAALSRACHHHPYELSPTAEELSGWLHHVTRLVDRLRAVSC